MFRMSSLALVSLAALLATACGSSSGGGGGGDEASAMEIEALRHELFAAGVEPLPAPPVISDELFALGQALFFDKILSGNQEISCATCHLPQFSTGDGRTLADGVHGFGLGPNRGGGEMIPRNSPPLFALHLKDELFWDGHVRLINGIVFVPSTVRLTAEMRTAFSPGLELLAAQAMLPPVSREEMRGMPGENPLGDLGDGYNSSGGSPESTTTVWVELTERLLDLPGYVQLLQAAYPGVELQDLTFAHVGNAIAAFETRAFARTDSPFERFVGGDDKALDREQVRGGLEFYGMGCADCHSGSLLSDQRFHNTGLPQLGPGVNSNFFGVPSGWDIGRENATRRVHERFQFRTPSLINVALTGPYGHAGQFAELRDMVAHYEDVVVSNQQYDIQSNVVDPALVLMLTPNSDQVLATLDPKLQAVIDFDVDAVVDFLHALTAESATDLSDIVPASVPSGLPIF
jgi:cytochrome c peroxidase